MATPTPATPGADGTAVKATYAELVSPAVAGAKNGIVDQMTAGVTQREATSKTLLSMPTGRRR